MLTQAVTSDRADRDRHRLAVGELRTVVSDGCRPLPEHRIVGGEDEAVVALRLAVHRLLIIDRASRPHGLDTLTGRKDRGVAGERRSL